MVIHIQFILCLPDEITIEVATPTQIKISGCDKELVGKLQQKLDLLENLNHIKEKVLNILTKQLLEKQVKQPVNRSLVR